ncbi:hypothetical protein [Pedobacter xixiisoli]|uniref:Ferredoxin subunit of nitrite reductase or a ring-hydroxylating dioxygenase n=1 Tax=Pedobacter xixiisoli TaxID=1476464 RepID=A0A286AAQ1_9SPHI|nr:hypothetical protein [Pedobacter xixiisoli]SOD18907.1 Ferredoxin subunit of nitrite reductase or a ring-hydroxylating dioxygenase [Pedobacter xixiisoli]
MRRYFGIVILFLLFASCGKEQNFVPDYPVNYNITTVEFGITATNGVLLVPNRGVAGLMIVRTPNGYVAFDRCSTVNPEKACAVTPDDNGFTATDPCSGAKYLLLDGSPQKAPAKTSLKRYTVTVTGNAGTGTIHVSN